MFHELVFGTIRDVISYHLGLTFLRAVTTGRYPPAPVSENNRAKVEVVGIVSVSYTHLKRPTSDPG